MVELMRSIGAPGRPIQGGDALIVDGQSYLDFLGDGARRLPFAQHVRDAFRSSSEAATALRRRHSGAELDKRQQGAMKRIESLGAGPDYAAAEDQLESIEKQWKGLEPSTAAAAQRARFASDAAIKKELAAGRALQKLLASFDMSKSSTKKKLIPELEKFVNDLKTVAAHL